MSLKAQGTGEAERYRRPLVRVSAIDFRGAPDGRQSLGTFWKMRRL